MTILRAGDDYRESIRDGREVWIDGERVADVRSHAAFEPIVDVRDRIYNMAHERGLRGRLGFGDPASGAVLLEAHKLPREQHAWQRKRNAVDATCYELGRVVIRVGDETVGELWSLYDGQDVLNEVDPAVQGRHKTTSSALFCRISLTCRPTPNRKATGTTARRTRTRTGAPRIASSCSLRPRPGNSGYAGHQVTFEFAQSPPFAHLNAVFMNFDWNQPLRLVHLAAGLSD